MNFINQLEKFDSQVALINNKNEKILYKDLLATSDSIVNSLLERKLIFLLCENNYEFISTYIGCLRKKIVPALLSSQIDLKLLINLIDIYLPKYILLPKSRNIEIKNYTKIYNLENYVILEKNKKKDYTLNNDLALLLSTSGSTGNKKFVRISYDNLDNNTQNIVKYLNIKKNHRTVTTMPPYYTYGLSIINTHLYVGASILVTNLKIIEKSFWNLMKSYKINSFGGVPYFYEILKKLNFANMNLSDLKYITQAGGPIDKNIGEYFLEYSKKNKVKFIIMYGQAEATSRMTFLPYENLQSKLGSVGIPIPGGKISIANKKKDLYSEGEIIYSGKNVSFGYATNKDDLRKGDENKGQLFTGDFGKLDKDGYLYIIGRKSRTVKILGHRINLSDLDKLLKEKGYTCVCTGANNQVTVFYNNKKYDKKILSYLSKITNINSNCFKMKFIKSFPMNETGKILYKDLQ